MSKKTVEAVEKAGGEFIVPLKENQKTLLREVREGCDFLAPTSSYIAPVEKKRNRLKHRCIEVFRIQDCLVESNRWKAHIGCTVRIKRCTELLDTKTKEWKKRAETAYYLCTHQRDATDFTQAIREHWHTENRNHYGRDVSLGEDASRIRTQAGIFARLRSFALNILRINHVNNVKAALFENALDFEGLMNMKELIA